MSGRVPTLLQLAGLGLLLLGCDGARRPDLDTGEASNCAEGFAAEGRQCVPLACGTGRWGTLDLGEDAVYVDIDAAEGGVGSEGAPFRSIQAGLDLAGSQGGGTVAVAAGSYSETLVFSTDHPGVQLAGRCRELVTLDAAGGDESTPGIDIDTRYGDVELSGVSVVGSSHLGVRVDSGTVRLVALAVEGSASVGVEINRSGVPAPTTVEMEGCDVVGNTEMGVLAWDQGMQVSLVDTVIRDTRPTEAGTGGYGILARYGVALSLEACDIASNTEAGIVAVDSGTEIALLDTVIRDTRTHGDGRNGWGIWLGGGAALTAQGCAVVGNAAAGILALESGTQAALLDTSVQDTVPDGTGAGGYGLGVGDGATLTAEGCEVSGNMDIGVVALDDGTEVSLADTVVRGTVAGEDGDAGYGISVFSGAELTADGCWIAGNMAVGIVALDDGTEVSLFDTVVQDSRPSGSEGAGWGISVGTGAALVADGCEIVGSWGTGLHVDDPFTEVALVDTVIRDTLPLEATQFGSGISLWGGAGLTAEGCEILRNTGYGIGVGDAGTQAALVDTVVRDTVPDRIRGTGVGIAVHAGAALTAEGCDVAGNTLLGIAAFDPGTQVELRDTTVRDTLPLGNGNVGHGMEIADGATLLAEGCEFTGNSSVGIAAFDAGTQVLLVDSTITGTAVGYFIHQGITAIGLGSQNGAFVGASGLLVHENEGPGLYVLDGGSIACDGCVLRGNQFAGAVAVGWGVLDIADSEITDTQQSANLGGGVGVFAAEQWDWGPPSITVRDSVISGNQVAGAWLAGAGRYVLTDNEVSASAAVPHGATIRCGDGVYATGIEAGTERSGLQLSGNRFEGNQGSGLFLDDAHAELAGNTWTGNEPDLWVQGDACLSPGDDWVEAPTSEVCPEWDRPACELEFVLNLSVSEIEAGRLRAPPTQSAHGLPSVRPEAVASTLWLPVRSAPDWVEVHLYDPGLPASQRKEENAASR